MKVAFPPPSHRKSKKVESFRGGQVLSGAHLLLFSESLVELPRLSLLGGIISALLLRVGLKENVTKIKSSSHKGWVEGERNKY